MHRKFGLLGFFIIISLPFFLFLGRDSIQIWDEARNTLNLYEMYQSKNYLVMTYHGTPDMWNTKPPLLHWIQSIFIEIFGFNEFAIRLPSAIAGFLTCVIIWYFFKKNYTNKYLPYIASFVLASSRGFIDIHSARTGDYDSLLVLFSTISALSIYSYIDTLRSKYLYYFFISLSLGVLTKSIAILLILPGIGLFILLSRNVLTILKSKHFYLGSLIFVVIVSSFYLLREKYNPGYIDAVLENEILGRYNKGLEGNENPFNFYYENFKTRFKWWLYFIPIGLLFGFLNKNARFTRLTLFSASIFITHFLIISSAKTKLLWYELPEYPFLSIIVSIGLLGILKLLHNETIFEFGKITQFKKQAITIFFLITCIIPFGMMMKKIVTDEQEEYYRNNQILPRYFKEVLEGKRELEDNICVCVSMLNQHYHTEYYLIKLKEKNYNINFCDWKNIPENQIIIMGHDDWLKTIIEEYYEHEILEHHQSDWNYWGIKKYLIKKKIKEFENI